MAAKKKAKRRAAKRTKVQAETFARTFKGNVHKVAKTEGGYRYAGNEYRSLTAVAKRITGYKSVSGPRFFGSDGGAR